MNKPRLVGVLCACTVFVSLSIDAATIVDTGVPTDSLGLSVVPSQWVAGQFSLDQSFRLTSIEGHISAGIFGAGNSRSLTLSVYQDAGGLPDESSQVFSDVFSVQSEAAGFFGVSDMGLVLSSGTYWASFEVRSDQNFVGSMKRGAPNPLVDEATKNAVTGIWTNVAIIQGIGLRIDAEIVPIPAAVWLFGSGLLGLIGVAGHRKRRNC